MRERKHELSAWMILEVAKTWPEADGDTAEAIDFCEFYGREMLRYASDHPLTHIPGEQNHLEYVPLGVGAVIPPWNFPCAIMAGMTAASVVPGNTVVLKPSSDAPAIAGASDDGFKTTVLPVTTEAAVMPAMIAHGKFQGGITAPTPSGTYSRWFCSPGMCVSGWSLA